MGYKFILNSFFVCFLFASEAAYSKDIKNQCGFLVGDYSQLLTTKLARLSSLKLGLNIDSPIDDANLRMSNGDYRVLVFTYHKIIIPGFGSSSKILHEPALICNKLGFRFVDGLDNPRYDPPVRILANAVINYMESYNRHVVETMKQKH